jgi:hypothetical protein
MKKYRILITILIIVTTSTFSQEINVHINDIREERHMNGNNNFIELTGIINGIKTTEFNQVKIKEINKAIDDKGNSLNKIDLFWGDKYSHSNKIIIKLDAPPRNSTKISLLEGTIKYFNPSISNNSKIIINNPLDSYNTNLLSLYRTDIKLTLIDKDLLNFLLEKNKLEYQTQIQKLIKLGGLSEALVKNEEGFKHFIKGYSNSNQDKSFVFYIEDPENKIVEIYIYNEKGEKMNWGTGRTEKTNLKIDFKEKPNNNWKIEILVENEKSIKEYKFMLQNITLP